MTSADRQELHASIRRLLRKGVELPPIPLVAADLLRLTSAADPSFSDMCACIGRDPVTAAKLVGMSNSAFFRGRREFGTIKEAVVRLGVAVLRAFAVGAAVGSLAPVPEQWRAFRSTLWNHCIATGVGTRMIGEYTGRDRGDALFLGGLLRDVGNLATLHVALEHNPNLESECVVSLLENFRVEAGAIMLSHWGIPESHLNLLKARPGKATTRDARHRDALIINYASDVCRALGLGLPESEPVDLVEHPVRVSLQLPRTVVAHLEEELVPRVQELAPYLTH